ncbi:two pore domain potassium channel family protein [Candidatus Peregrinibacteria bacterium]|nr:two pore domain potassium channel family protein [Candidatus Peregrinibacteria bacterium]
MLKNLKIQELIRAIEERDDLVEKDEMKRVFLDYFHTLPLYNHRERGICYYYILRIILKTHQLYETLEAQKYYHKMMNCLRKQHEQYKEKLRNRSNLNKQSISRIAHFYIMMERFYSSLEVLYDKKDFIDALSRAYEEKMYYRKHKFLFQKKRWRYFEYEFLDITCKYGDSFARWGLTAFLFALIMSGIYFLIDMSLPLSDRMVGINGHWFDYIYYSLITVTSLGYGDILPTTFATKFLASFEVFFGFIMLGVFVNLIQKKL